MAVEAISPARVHEQARQWEHTALTTELLLAIGAVVLSILGIIGVFLAGLAAITVIGLGTILLFQSLEFGHLGRVFQAKTVPPLLCGPKRLGNLAQA
jgi:hypothetical protein